MHLPMACPKGHVKKLLFLTRIPEVMHIKCPHCGLDLIPDVSVKMRIAIKRALTHTKDQARATDLVYNAFEVPRPKLQKPPEILWR